MNQDGDYPGKRTRTSSPGDDLEAIAKARGAAVDRQLAALEEAQLPDWKAEIAAMLEQYQPADFPRRDRLIAAIRLLTVDDDEPETLPPLDRAEWPDYYQELREAAEAYFGDDFRVKP